MNSNPLDDLFGSVGFAGTPLGKASAAAQRDAKKKSSPEPIPLPQIRGKQIDGVLYVRAGDVADALEKLAPTTARRLITKLRGKAA